MDYRHATLLMVLACLLAGCRPARPRAPSHLVLSTRERGEGLFQIVDLSRGAPVFEPVITVPDALAATQGRSDEPLATHLGAALFVLTSRAGNAEIVRISRDGTWTKLRTSLKLASAELTPRPLRIVDGRIFLVTATQILSSRIDGSRDYLEPVDTAGFHGFATLSGDLVTAHDMRVGDPFDYTVLRLQGSGSLAEVGRLANELLSDVVRVDGADLAANGLLFVSGGQLRSVFVQPGKRVVEPEATLPSGEHAVKALAALDQELVICSHRVFALPGSFDEQSRARGLSDAWCRDLIRRGPVWALARAREPVPDGGFRRRLPADQIVRVESDGAGRAQVVASHPLPPGTDWTSFVR